MAAMIAGGLGAAMRTLFSEGSAAALVVANSTAQGRLLPGKSSSDN
jgi:hypothetical protein